MSYESSSKRIRIVYFSGTGGTARAAGCLKQALEARGCQVVMEPLERRMPDEAAESIVQDESPCDILILLYAVHAFNAPEPVYDWIKEQPQVRGLPAAVISVSGGGEVWPNTASRASCIKALEDKGYDVSYERMLIMPCNVFVETEDHLAIQLLRCLPLKAEHCAAEILGGIRCRKRPAISARIVSAIFKLEKKGARWFAKRLTVSEACISCGWCTNSCPRRNISMDNGKPVFGGQCVACLRCYYGCPKSAIQTGAFRFLVIKKGYSLDKLEERMNGIEPEPAEKLAIGIFASLRDYLLYEEV
jgi:ferredoxin/flavodoxin